MDDEILWGNLNVSGLIIHLFFIVSKYIGHVSQVLNNFQRKPLGKFYAFGYFMFGLTGIRVGFIELHTLSLAIMQGLIQHENIDDFTSALF